MKSRKGDGKCGFGGNGNDDDDAVAVVVMLYLEIILGRAEQ